LEGYRTRYAAAHLEAVIKSLRELLEYAGSRSIRLGLAKTRMWFVSGKIDYNTLDEPLNPRHAPGISLL
jgi:hypothetical protein